MMKTRLTVSTLLAAALMAGTEGLRAEEGHDHGKHDHSKHDRAKHDHAAETAPSGAPMTSHDGMTSLYRHLEEMEKELAADNLGGFHGHDEAIQAAVKGLDKDTSLTAARRKRVQGYVNNVLRLSGKLHAAADGNKLDQAKKDFPKLKAQVDLLDKQFAHTHKPGTAGRIREDGGHQGKKSHSHHEEK